MQHLLQLKQPCLIQSKYKMKRGFSCFLSYYRRTIMAAVDNSDTVNSQIITLFLLTNELG